MRSLPFNFYTSQFDFTTRDHDYYTGLRMPSKWHISKEGQVATKIDNAAACLCFLNYNERKVDSEGSELESSIEVFAELDIREK
jgi:hypothetical protein